VNAHVDLEIADFVAGRLSEERRKQIEDHLRECDRCSAAAAWANDFRREALRQGLRHLDPLRIVELSLRAEIASEAEQAHLASCASCRAEVAWAKEHPTPDAETEDDEPPAVPTAIPRARPKRLPPAWLAAAAAMIVIALLLVPRIDRFDPTQLAIVEPLPVRISRSIPNPGSFEESRLLGLDSYRSGDYVSARKHLLHALSIETGRAETLMYLGSAELLDEHPETASEYLRKAAEYAPIGAVHDESRWQLANALLLLGRTDEATHELSILADRDGPRRSDSLALLEAIAEMK